MPSLRANKPTVTPVTMVDSAAYVQIIMARPSFMPRFWQKMPEDEQTTCKRGTTRVSEAELRTHRQGAHAASGLAAHAQTDAKHAERRQLEQL